MKTTLPMFQQAAVLVIGDVMLDRYWHGLTNRISPEAPVPVVKVEQIEDRPGGAANVAMNTAALGVKTCLIGLTGQDEAAQLLERQLQQANVACDFVQLTSHPTITKLRVLAKHQQLIRLDFEQGFENVSEALIYPKITQQLSQVGAMILSDYGKGALTHVQGMIQLATQAQLPVLVDPKGKDFSRYRGATLLTPNLAEFEAVVGRCANEQQMIDKGLALMAEHDFAALLITRSEQGMTLLQPNLPPLHLPTQAQEVYDVTGAGDTVIGMIGSALAAGKNLQQACYLANVAAGIVVGKLGTSTVLPIEVENAIHGRGEAGFGLLNELQLKQAVRAANQRGETVVMTNGCFDILHAGHVAYLQQARALGDRLIVAVNSDASTARLKGKDRPINPLEQRMQVLSALAAVDWVVAFEEDTPQRLISEILPDILVKGGDYQVDEIAGGQEVIANGGQVLVLSFKEGCSTTKIIHAIQTKSS